jgi:hypothetical protein
MTALQARESRELELDGCLRAHWQELYNALQSVTSSSVGQKKEDSIRAIHSSVLYASC